MKKILLLLILIVCFFSSLQGKKNGRSGQISNTQLKSTKYHHKNSKKEIKSVQKEKLTKRKNINEKQSIKIQNHEHQYLHWNEPAFWWNTLLAICNFSCYRLVFSCAGGFFSGMTVGLNSLDKLHLKIQQITGNEQQKKAASRILSTIKDHHLFLVTLLIGNAIVLQWLPLIVHKIMPDWAAILTSTFTVVIVAEIAPMSYTTGPNKYQIAYKGSKLVDFCIKVFYVIAYPVARGLDALLGVHDSSKIQRRDFLAFINDRKKNQLHPLQITMFNQLLIGPHVTSVKNIMTSIFDVYMLGEDEDIDQNLIKNLQQSQIQIVFILASSRMQQEGKIKLTRPLKVKRLALQYLKNKHKFKANNEKLKLNEIISYSQPIRPIADQNHKPQQKFPIIYSDTGLLDAKLILGQRKSYFSYVHKDQRRKGETDIAFLDFKDFQVSYGSCCLKGSEQIIGIVTLNDVLKGICDFNGDLNSILSTFKESQITQEAPKKRKLVKRASIISVHSSYSRDE